MKLCTYYMVLAFVCLISYGALLFILTTYISAFSFPDFSFKFLYPLFVVLFYSLLLIISNSTPSEKFFSICYVITGVSGGFVLNYFMICLVYKLVCLFKELNKIASFFFIVVSPFILTLYGYINAYFPRIDYVNLTYPNFKGKQKICHLSDIHLGSIYQKKTVERIVNKVIQLEPDIVVITGDVSDGTELIKADWLMPFNKISVPILYVTGNHEMVNGKDQALKEIGQTKIIHIGESYHPFAYNGINYIGVDYDFDLKEELSDFSLDNSCPNVLLTHVPSLKPSDLKEFKIFLMLAGHTHGGQVFPLQILVWLGNKCFAGLYSTEDKKNHVYVSTGISSAVVPMRILSIPKIGMITIQGVN